MSLHLNSGETNSRWKGTSYATSGLDGNGRKINGLFFVDKDGYITHRLEVGPHGSIKVVGVWNTHTAGPSHYWDSTTYLSNGYRSVGGRVYSIKNGRLVVTDPRKAAAPVAVPKPAEDSQAAAPELAKDQKAVVDKTGTQPRINNTAEGRRIMNWQRILGVKADGWWGKNTAAAYKAYLDKLKTPAPTAPDIRGSVQSPSLPTSMLLLPSVEENVNSLAESGLYPSSQQKYRKGGILVNKYQQGGAASDPMDLLAQVAAKFLQGDTQSGQQLAQVFSDLKVGKQLMQAVQQGVQQKDKRAIIIAQAIQALSGSRKARLGAKLEYFKKGGVFCPALKKVTKHLQGGSFKEAFNAAYGKLRYFTWNGKVYAAYKGDKRTDKNFQGAVDNIQELANAFKDYGAGLHLGWNPGANTVAVKHNSEGNMQGTLDDVVVTAKRISPKLKANNQRKQYFDQWTAYVKKWHPNMVGRFKNTMQNMGYNYNWNTGTYDKNGRAVYRLKNGQLLTANIYTGELERY